MNSNKAHITMILDRSGSMSAVASDVIGAVNRFIDDQKATPGECTFTLVQFDDRDPYEVIQDAVKITDANHLSATTYVPRGNTPLLDAIGKGIVSLGETLANTPENDRPGKVIFVIQTDGQENASREYTYDRIKEMVKHQTDSYNWQFVFLGADQDAIASGGSIGVRATSSLSYNNNPNSNKVAFAATSANVSSLRTGKKSDLSYTSAQRDAANTK
jgi:Mg-chelatase subunit ChlD